MNPRSFTLALFSMVSVACSTSLAPVDGSTSDSSVDSSTPIDTPSALDTPAPNDASTDMGTTLLDGADPFSDAGPLGPPAWVPITVLTTGSCPSTPACGGDVVGTWDVSGACLEIPIDQALSVCPGAMVTRREGRARGRVTFSSSPMIARRVAQSEAAVDCFVPSVCAQVLGGCAGLQTTLQRYAPTATCTSAPTGCNCQATAAYVVDDTDGYRTANNEIISSTLNKHWAYCVTANELEYHDTSPSGQREPGIIKLQRR